MNNLKEKIGLGAVVVVGINAMIGAGVLTMPTILSAYVGPAGIVSIIFSIILILCMGLSLGRLAEIYPGEGWSYLYPSKWGGHLVGIFSAFCYLFGIVVGMGFLVQQAGIWLHKFLSFISPKPLGIIILLLLMVLVIAGAKTSSFIQYLIVILVVVPLALTAIFCWFHFDIKLVTPFLPYGMASIFRASPIILFAFFGFESIASLYPVVKNAHKNVPIAFILSILTVGIVYLLFFYGVLFAIPSSFFAGGLKEPLSNVLIKFFSSFKALSLLVLIGASFGIIGTIHSMLWSVSSLLTGILQKSKSKIINLLLREQIWNEKFSVVVIAILIFFAALFVGGEFLITLTALLIVFSYMLSIIALLFIKSEWKSGHNIITLFAMIGGGVMIYFAYEKLVAAFLNFF